MVRKKYKDLLHHASLIMTLLGLVAAGAIALNDIARHDVFISRLQTEQTAVEKRLIRVDGNIEILMRQQKIEPLPPVE